MNIRSIVSILLILWTASLSAQISVNTWFDVLVDKPIDDRMDLATIGDTTTIDFPANGLLAYIEDADEHWYYNGSMWVKMEGGKIDSVYVRGDSMFVSETGIEFYIGASDAAIAQALADSIAAIGSGITDYVARWASPSTLSTGALRDDGSTISTSTSTTHPGGYSARTSVSFSSSHSVPSGATGTHTGILQGASTTLTANNTSVSTIGGQFQAYVRGSYNTGAVTGILARAGSNKGTNTVGTVVGVMSGWTNSSTSSTMPNVRMFQAGGVGTTDNATITNATGFYFVNPTYGTGTTVTNAYGVYLEDVNNGSSLNYALYTNAGKNYFGDNVGIKTTSAAYSLDMSGVTTSALRLPQTPTSSRPVGANGLLFYDPTTTWYHGYRNGAFNTFVTGVAGGAVNLNWAGYINMPKVNNAVEAALTGMSVGDIMYNSQSSKTRIYTSAGWGDITPWVTNVTGSTWNNGAAVNIGVFSSYPVTDGLYTSNSARIVFGESGGGSSQSGLVFSRNPIGIGHSGSPASMPGILTVSTNRINNSTYPGLANRHLVTIFPSSGNSFNALPWSSSGQGYGLIGSPASSTVYRHNLLVMPQGSSTPKIKFNAIPILGKEYTGYTNAVILNSNSSTGSSVGSALLVQTVNSTRQEFAATVMSGIDVSAVVDSFYVDAGSTSMYAVGLRAYSKIGDDVVDTVGIDMLSVGIIAEAYGPDSTYAILSKAGKNFFQDTVQVATAPTNTAPEGGVLVRDSDGNVGKKMMDNGVLFATTDGAGEATIIFNVTMPDASYTINLFNVATGVTSCYPVSTTTTGMTVRVYDSGGAVVSTGVTIHWSVIDN